MRRGPSPLRSLCSFVRVCPRKCEHLVFGERAGNRSHGHVHVVGTGALDECVELLVKIEFILFGQGGRADAVAAGTVAGCTCGDTALRVACVNKSLHRIAVAVPAVRARSAFTAIFRQSGERCKIGGQVGVLLIRERLCNRGNRTRQAGTRAKVIQLFVEDSPTG
jgi:hypothetical protein